MSVGGGMFAVARSIWDDPDFADEPFTEREAWLWLIGAAAYREFRVRGAHGTVTLARGEFCFSTRFLGQRWKWSKDRAHRYIGKLRNRDMIIDTKRDNGETVYAIRNYDVYQTLGSQKPGQITVPCDTDRDTDRAASATKMRHRSQRKRDKEESSSNTGIQDNKVPLAKANGQHAHAAADLPLGDLPGIPPKPEPKPKPPDPWKPVYDRGKEVLGSSAGGIITKLKLLFDNKPHKVMAKIEDAAEQREPLKWITAFLWSVKDDGKLSGEYIGGVPP